MKRLLFIPIMSLYFLTSYGQNLENLEQKLKAAKTDKEKVYALDSLALYYSVFYMGKMDSIADNYSKQSISIAENSGSKELKAISLLFYGRRLMSTMKGMTQAEGPLQKAAEYSRTNNFPFYERCAYLGLAQLNWNSEKSLQYYNSIYTSPSSSDYDSLKVLAMLSEGLFYQTKYDYVTSFRKLALALLQAERLDNLRLQCDANFYLSLMYSGLNSYDKGIEYALKSIELAKKLQNAYLVFGGYQMLGEVYRREKRFAEAWSYFEKAYEISDANNWPPYIKGNVELSQYFSYIEAGNFSKASEFYDAHPELETVLILENDIITVHNTKGGICKGEGKLDSAAFYFKLAIEDAKTTGKNPALNRNALGTVFLEQGKIKEAIGQFEIAREAVLNGGDLLDVEDTYHHLDTAYQMVGDYRQAFLYHRLYDKTKDSLNKLSDKQQITIAEVENESQRIQLEQQKQEERIRTRHNLEYIAITIAIVSVFVLLVLLGVFSTSSFVIRSLGFFGLIFLFEFIILLTDNQIHKWTNGEPWKVLVIKIVLISFLLPFHHYIEAKVVYYLVHRNKLKLGKTWLIGKSKIESKKQVAD